MSPIGGGQLQLSIQTHNVSNFGSLFGWYAKVIIIIIKKKIN